LISGSGQRGIDTWRTREALVPPVREAVRRLLDLLLEHTESDVAPVGVSSLAEGPTWPGPAQGSSFVQLAELFGRTTYAHAE